MSIHSDSSNDDENGEEHQDDDASSANGGYLLSFNSSRLVDADSVVSMDSTLSVGQTFKTLENFENRLVDVKNLQYEYFQFLVVTCCA